MASTKKPADWTAEDDAIVNAFTAWIRVEPEELELPPDPEHYAILLMTAFGAGWYAAQRWGRRRAKSER